MDKDFIKEGIRFQCQQTGRCCLARGQSGYVYLTREDRKRLASFLGLSVQVFIRKYCQKTDGFFHLKNPDEDCMFLAGKACGVYEGRPVQCRTWPFWPENLNAKAWKEDVQSFCKGVGKGRRYSPEEILALVKESSLE